MNASSGDRRYVTPPHEPVVIDLDRMQHANIRFVPIRDDGRHRPPVPRQPWSNPVTHSHIRDGLHPAIVPEAGGPYANDAT